VRGAILLSVIPGLLAAGAIVYAIRHTPRPTPRARQPIRIKIRPVLQSRLRPLMIGIGAFEIGNLAATLLILRATELLSPEHGTTSAAQLALGLYTAYNLAATLASFPAGSLGDRIGAVRILLIGACAFLVAYTLLAITGPSFALLTLAFLLAGVGVGCAETAEHAAVAGAAPIEL
jgi:MFS family permease